MIHRHEVAKFDLLINEQGQLWLVEQLLRGSDVLAAKVVDGVIQEDAVTIRLPISPTPFEVLTRVDPVLKLADERGMTPEQLLQGGHEMFAKLYQGESVPVETFKRLFADLHLYSGALVAHLIKLKKEDILRGGGQMFSSRYRNETKAEIVDARITDMASDFSLGRAMSVFGRSSIFGMVEPLVRKTDQAFLDKFAQNALTRRQEVSAQRAQRLEGVQNPQTLDDFHLLFDLRMRNENLSQVAIYRSLSVDKQILFDTLTAAKLAPPPAAPVQPMSVPGPAAEGAQNPAVLDHGGVVADIVQTKHTKTGRDIWVIALAQRVERAEYERLLGLAKSCGGYYSSFRGNGAIPGFHFSDRAGAERFFAQVGGSPRQATADQAGAAPTVDPFAENRSQTPSERLIAMGTRLLEKANEALNRPRLANTARRIAMANSAEDEANRQAALGQTLLNIAQAQQAGTCQFLGLVRQKKQVETLLQFLKSAADGRVREQTASYSEYLAQLGRPPSNEDVAWVEYPKYTAFVSDLASVGRQLSSVEGSKRVGEVLLKTANDVSKEYLRFANENLAAVSQFRLADGQLPDFPTFEAAQRAVDRSGYRGRAIPYTIKRGHHSLILSPQEAIVKGIWSGADDKRIALRPEFAEEVIEKMGRIPALKSALPWMREVRERRATLKGMGIEGPAQLRCALRELVTLMQAPRERDRIKDMERALVGRANDGLDFFPTPEDVAGDALDSAGLGADSWILEPQAGMAHIADQARDRCACVDVAELSPSRREILVAKGYEVVGEDFLAMDPDRGLPGDVWRDRSQQVQGVLAMRAGLSIGEALLRCDDGREVVCQRDDLDFVQKMPGSGYDAIVMNPPFSDGRDMKHVQHALRFVRPGGRLVSIMSEGTFFRQDRAANEFRAWLDSVGGSNERLPPGSFTDRTLPVTTQANARLITIERMPSDTDAANEGQSDGDEAIERPRLAA